MILDSPGFAICALTPPDDIFCAVSRNFFRMADKTRFKRLQVETNGSRRGDFIDPAGALQAQEKFNFIILQAIDCKRFFSAASG